MYTDEILLAEDDLMDAQFFKRALSKLDTPPSLQWCKNGTEAYQRIFDLRQQDILPRLAILDIKMPGMSGIELLEKIKSNPKTKDLPVIILSGSDEPRDIASAYDHGANGYLVKPNKFQELKELVAAIHQFWIKTNRPRPLNATA